MINHALLLLAATTLSSAAYADTKISAMTSGGTVQTTDQIPAVRAGANVRVTVAPSAATDTTNASNITSGTLSVNRFNGGTNANSATALFGDGTWKTPSGGGTASPGGTSGQVQFNSAGALAGFTIGGDCSLNTGTGAIICGKTGGVSFAPSATTDATNAGNIASGTLSASRGGAGSVAGILKANGSGVVSAAASGTDYQAPLTLTTTGSSGAATLTGGTLNIPQYSGGGGGGTLTSVTSSSSDIVTNCSGASCSVGTTQAINARGVSTSYALLASDMGKVVTSAASAAAAWTLPAATTTGFGAGTGFTAINVGTANLTVTPPGGTTINGLTSLTLAQYQGANIVSDGTNYVAFLGATTAAGNVAFLDVAQTFSKGQSGTISHADFEHVYLHARFERRQPLRHHALPRRLPLHARRPCQCRAACRLHWGN